MKNNVRESYDVLTGRLRQQSRLGAVLGILHWDQEVIMPPGAADARARQVSTLAALLHEKTTDPDTAPVLDRLLQCPEAQFSEQEWCNIHEAKRDYDRETRVPGALVAEIAELGSRAHHIWVQARRGNRFADFAPSLKRMVALKTQWAHHVDPDRPPYDVNIDVFERGMTMQALNPLFARLKDALIPMIRAIQASPDAPDTSFLEGCFPIDKQESLGRRISGAMGFCFDRGRMDVSVHPFCGGAGPSDVRITTRYREDNFVESLYAVIHETGHGLYEQGRMTGWEDLPVAESLTMGIHESQSLFWERMIGQGRPFLKKHLPLIQETFPDRLQAVEVETFYRIKPSFIRVEADEVTYPLHVILRYEIEKGLFEGTLQVADLPAMWNSKMEEYLGIRPPTDTLGVLQDVHWSGGAFGYFPSYTLGALYACQFYRALKEKIGDIETGIADGRLSPVREWLNRNIHAQGRLHQAGDLCRQVTGEPLNPDYFLAYLRDKYQDIYRLNLEEN
ncbi:MAG: carboxypeptidase M32 [Nitrospinaceae bacterium]